MIPILLLLLLVVLIVLNVPIAVSILCAALIGLVSNSGEFGF